MAYTDVIAQLAVSLDMDSGGFVRKAHEAEKRADAIGKSFEQSGKKVTAAGGNFAAFGRGLAGAAAGIGVGVLADAARDAISSAAALKTLSAQLGVSAEDLQRFRYAARDVGVDQGQFDDALKTLTVNVGKAAAGSKPAAAAFAALGVAIKDGEGKIRPSSQILLDIANSIARIPDPASRAAAAAAIFGENGQKIAPMLAQGADAIKRVGDEAERTGKILSNEQAADAAKIQKQYDAVADQVSTGFKKIVIATASGLSASSDAIERWRQDLGGTETLSVFDALLAKVDAFEASLVAGAKNAYHQVDTAWQGIQRSTRAMASEVVASLTTKLESAWSTIKQRTAAASNHFFTLYDKVVGHSYVPDMVDGIAAEMARLDGVMVQPAGKATKATAETFEQLRSRVSSLLDRLFPEQAAENRFLSEVRDLTDAFKAGQISAGLYEAALAKLESQMGMTRDGLTNPALALDPTQDEKDMLAGIDAELDRATGDWIDGLDKDLATPAENATTRVADAFGQMASGVIDSLRGMVESFKHGDILSGIQQMLDVVLQVVQALGQAGIIKGVPAGMNYGGARAKGGPVVPGRSYLVGENGPEFITPSRRGFVHPNGSGAMPPIIIKAVKGDYFDLIVDDRASKVAAPMAGRAAIMGAGGAEQRAATRQRRAIP